MSISFADRPNAGFVSGGFRMTFETRKPPPTTFEFDRDDIEIGVIVTAAGLGIYVNTIYSFTVDEDCHFF